MNVWLIWLAVLAGVGAWLWIGFGIIAPAWITKEVARNIEQYPLSARIPSEIARWRRAAASDSWGPALIWPFMFLRYPAIWSASRSRPTEFESQQRIARLEQRNAQLERELHMDR